jgi:hypothetical protein
MNFVTSKEAARRLTGRKNIAFLVLPVAGASAGLLSKSSPVLVPLGREDSNYSSSVLNRPTTSEVGEALQSMGYSQQEAIQLARKSGRSVTVLSRQIPSASAPHPDWARDRDLVPALLLGGWNADNTEDCEIVCRLAGVSKYEEYEAKLRTYLKVADSPLEHEGSVWHVRAPVDAFVHLAHFVGREHLERFSSLFQRVFTECDPALDLLPRNALTLR